MSEERLIIIEKIKTIILNDFGNLKNKDIVLSFYRRFIDDNLFLNENQYEKLLKFDRKINNLNYIIDSRFKYLNNDQLKKNFII